MVAAHETKRFGQTTDFSVRLKNNFVKSQHHSVRDANRFSWAGVYVGQAYTLAQGKRFFVSGPEGLHRSSELKT